MSMGDIIKLTNGTTGGPVFVYVQDGRIIRITPMELDDNDPAPWVIRARGRNFSPPRKTYYLPLFSRLAFHDLFTQKVATAPQTG